MHSVKKTEHFCTLFDSTFLPLGIALHASLMAHAQSFRLWVICMDEAVETQLSRLGLENVKTIPLAEVETPELKAVKSSRTRGEYCWTLTSFTFEAVFRRDPTVERVTYLDADLMFFDDPRFLLEELDQSGRHVLITEHSFGPEYRDREKFGRFCVQFLTSRKTEPALRVLHWWQQRCVEWCHAYFDDQGRFGDQKYLDQWPELFPEEVHVSEQGNRTLGPWNVRHYVSMGECDPVFYHYHGFRIVRPDLALLYNWHRVEKGGMRFYDVYMDAVNAALRRMHSIGLPTPCVPMKEKWSFLRYLKRKFISRTIAYRRLAG